MRPVADAIARFGLFRILGLAILLAALSYVGSVQLIWYSRPVLMVVYFLVFLLVFFVAIHLYRNSYR